MFSHHYSLKSIIYAIIILILFIIMGEVIAKSFIFQKNLENEHTIALVGAHVSQNIQRDILDGISSIDILANLLKYNDFNTSHFQKWASEIIKSHHSISGLQFAKDGIVSHIYPYNEHKKALGHDLLKDKRRQKGALVAIVNKKLTFIGPIKLIQNGKYSVIARKPIFYKENNQEKFWGFATAILYIEDLFKISLENIKNANLEFKLSGYDPDATKQPVFIKSNLFSPKNARNFDIHVPNGEWVFSLVPKNEQNYLSFIIKVIFLLIGLIGGGLIFKYENKLKKEQEQTLIQQSKLAIMGEMIGAIAHQWKQPLNALSLIVQNLKMKYTRGLLNKEEIDNIVIRFQKQIEYMNNTINDFRNFSKPSNEKSLFLACESAIESKKLLDVKLKNLNVTFEINKHEHFQILGSETEFRQVILNLYTNAIDVFVEKSIQNPKIELIFTKTKDTGVIKIRDNAGGIDNELLPHKLFEAYVSTKGDKGTGIGLQISKLIIEKKFNGKIWVHNTQDGAEFIIELPIIN